MYIKELHLKNFGKFKDKKIRFENGINIIYGENEAGKSTLHSFIKGMFFGIEKQRGKTKRMDTYDKYEPWEGNAFYEGSMRFFVGEKPFLLERNFYRKEKRVSLVSESDFEELSVEQGDLSVLLGGLNETGYTNTISIGQMACETEKELGELIQNHMENYEKTGDMDFNYTKAVARLKEQRKQVEKEIKGALAEKEQKQLELRKEEARCQQQRIEKEKKIQEIRSNLKKPEPICTVPIEETWEEASKEASKETSKEIGKETGKDTHWLLKRAMIILAVVFVISTFLFPQMEVVGWILAIIVMLIVFFHSKKKTETDAKNSVKDKQRNQEEQERYKQAQERYEQTQERYEQTQEQYKQAQEGYQKQLWLIERLEEEIQELKTNQENILEVIGEQALYPEQVIKLGKEVEAIDLALETLENLSEGLHKERSEELNERMSQILSAITNEKYKQVVLDDRMQLNIWSEGKKLQVDQVSQGTLEQVYFAMRMSGAKFLYEEETLPLILDDAFVMYDETRLGAILKWLSKQPFQVLLFTCHKREEEILQSFKIPFSKEYL